MASISTPVLPSQRTIEWISIVPAFASMSNVMSTDESAIECVSGIRDGVCFAARTPATFAVVSTSPFGRARSTSFCSVDADMRTVADATASRLVLRFEPTSTIEMPPVSSRCEKSLSLIRLRLLQLLLRVHVQQRLPAMPRAPIILGDDLRPRFLEQAAQIVPPGGDARIEARRELRRVAGAEQLRASPRHGDEHRR